MLAILLAEICLVLVVAITSGAMWVCFEVRHSKRIRDRVSKLTDDFSNLRPTFWKWLWGGKDLQDRA